MSGVIVISLLFAIRAVIFRVWSVNGTDGRWSPVRIRCPRTHHRGIPFILPLILVFCRSFPRSRTRGVCLNVPTAFDFLERLNLLEEFARFDRELLSCDGPMSLIECRCTRCRELHCRGS